MQKIFILAALLVNIFSMQSYASEKSNITVRVPEKYIALATGAKPEIFITGEISDETIANFIATIVVQKIKGGTVYLNSPGGSLMAGIELGKIIRKNGFSTNVGIKDGNYGDSKAGECYSSCVFAYIGGYYRYMNIKSQLGVHRFSKVKTTANDLDIGQIVSAAITNYLKEMDVDVEFFTFMTKSSRDEIYILSDIENKNLRVVNNGTLPTTWNLVSTQDIMYLKGEQETWRGTGKFIFNCFKGTLVATIMYEAGENANLIANTATKYSLRIDQEFISIPKLLRTVEVTNDFVGTLFMIDQMMFSKILRSNQIGFAFHPQNPDLFYGFVVDTKNGLEKINNYSKFCISQRR